MNINYQKDLYNQRDSDYMRQSSSQKMNAGGGYKNQLTSHYDPSKPQFVPDDNEIRALFDVFKRNDKINLEEFLEVLKITSKIPFSNLFFCLQND